MKSKKYGLFFEFARRVARLALPRYRFENVLASEEPVVYVSHHQNMIGPISILAWLKFYVRTWVLSVFTTQEACYEHYTNFMFTKRYGWPSFIAKIVAWPLSYLVPWLVRSGRAIPVYRRSRKIVETFQMSVDALLKGENILIFPEVDYSSDSNKTSEIYEGFLHLEKYYFKETNQHLTFVPIFSDNIKNEVYSGKEIRFTGNMKFIEERKEIAQELQNELNRLAELSTYINKRREE